MFVHKAIYFNVWGLKRLMAIGRPATGGGAAAPALPAAAGGLPAAAGAGTRKNEKMK